MNPDQGTELRSGRVINSSSGTSSPIDPDMAQSSANDSDNNEASDISSQLSEIRENYEKKINELQSEFSQLKNLLMAVISKSDENNLPSSSQSSSKPTHRVGLDTKIINLIQLKTLIVPLWWQSRHQNVLPGTSTQRFIYQFVLGEKILREITLLGCNPSVFYDNSRKPFSSSP